MLKIQFPKVLAYRSKPKKILNRKTLINLYHSYIYIYIYIYPYLIYCIEAWGNATYCHLEQLYLIQKKVTKMISFSNYNTNSIDINRIGLMMYNHASNLLLPTMICILKIVKYIITLQDRNIYFMSIRVILISIQKVLETQVLAYGMLCSSKLR